MTAQTISTRLLFRTLEKTKFGSLKMVIGPSSEYYFGEGALVGEIRFRDLHTLQSVVRGGDIELALAIAREDVVISNEAAFIQWACQNDEILRASFHGRLISTFLPRVRRWFRPNTVEGAKKNIMAHYDLGNDFYRQWLDPSMTYSSALFKGQRQVDNLIEGQLQKYDRIIDELGITGKDHVLEIGCGWGGFFSRAVERTGCKVTAVMNSPAQAAHNAHLLKNKGLESNVELELTDYRFIQGKFDKVVSIEMVEAVGEKYWPAYFNKISSSLKSGGQALIQSITIRENRFQDYRHNPDFIRTLIFPGGMLLTNKVISDNVSKASLRNVTQPFEFGFCYAETLRQWQKNFISAWQDNLLPNSDRKFFNLWRFYLAYCEGAFKAERINVGHFVMENPR